MKTTDKSKQRTGAPPTANTGWLLSEEALIRLLLDTGRKLDAKQTLLPKTA